MLSPDTRKIELINPNEAPVHFTWHSDPTWLPDAVGEARNNWITLYDERRDQASIVTEGQMLSQLRIFINEAFEPEDMPPVAVVGRREVDLAIEFYADQVIEGIMSGSDYYLYLPLDYGSTNYMYNLLTEKIQESMEDPNTIIDNIHTFSKVEELTEEVLTDKSQIWYFDDHVITGTQLKKEVGPLLRRLSSTLGLSREEVCNLFYVKLIAGQIPDEASNMYTRMLPSGDFSKLDVEAYWGVPVMNRFDYDFNGVERCPILSTHCVNDSFMQWLANNMYNRIIRNPDRRDLLPEEISMINIQKPYGLNDRNL